MPQIPSRLPREYESPSPDHRTRYTGVVNTCLRYSTVLHLHQRVCHKVGDTMVRTSRFTHKDDVTAEPKRPAIFNAVVEDISLSRRCCSSKSAHFAAFCYLGRNAFVLKEL